MHSDATEPANFKYGKGTWNLISKMGKKGVAVVMAGCIIPDQSVKRLDSQLLLDGQCSVR